MTVYSRLQVYYESNPDVTRLDHLQKSILGGAVAKTWYEHKTINKFKDTLTLVKSEEETGTYKVLLYPDYFSTEIDKLIGDFYVVLIKPKKERKIIRKPIYSAKPNGNI